jgi:hypothetical protein
MAVSRSGSISNTLVLLASWGGYPRLRSRQSDRSNENKKTARTLVQARPPFGSTGTDVSIFCTTEY